MAHLPMLPLTAVFLVSLFTVTGSAVVPQWTAPLPDPNKPLGGYSTIHPAVQTRVFTGQNQTSGYNHNVMASYTTTTGFVLYWKSCQVDEDCNGQLMRMSTSDDGKTWSTAQVLFPNMTSPTLAATMEPAPAIVVNGRLYAGSSPGIHNTTHDASAQGSQCCLFPDALDPRNCGPPSPVAVEYHGNLMLREVKAGGELGDLFWAVDTAPTMFAAAGKANGVKTLKEMDAQTQADIRGLSPTQETPPCDPKSSGSLKCEACPGGCQLWNDISWSVDMSNERSTYSMPDGSGDVILYRAGEEKALWSSSRQGSTKQADWSDVVLTDIPNDKSNLNSGTLPDGRVFLTHNPVVPASGSTEYRDPETVATSKDGVSFDTVGVAVTCTALPTLDPPTTCAPRYGGHGKNPGPSYPQAVAVTDPAPKDLHGLWIATSVNKEDIFLVKLDYGSF